MDDRELSLEFIDAFCSGDLERMERLLAEDLRFRGPWLEADSRQDYLARLRSDPPEVSAYEIHRWAEGPDGVAVLWEYRPRGGRILISQWNRIRGGRIGAIRLVFDTSGRIER